MRTAVQSAEQARGGNGSCVGADRQLPSRPWDPLSWLTLAVLVLMSGLSVWHILSKKGDWQADPVVLGLVGWLFFALATANLARRQWRECVLVFLLFFTIGFTTKAYLEPVSDQLDHLQRTYDMCDKAYQPGRLNRGFWQYSMNSLFVCDTRWNSEVAPETVLFRLDLLHAIYVGMACVILYLVGSAARLPPRWALFSVVLCVSFMGTNKFAYFSYYSYGPTFTSICLYWLWIGFFFFTSFGPPLWAGLLTLPLLVTIMAVNHIQEVAFILFLASLWLLVHGTVWVVSKRSGVFLLSWLILLLTVFFILPQFASIRELVAKLFVYNYWAKNQMVLIMMKDVHVFGKIWHGYRFSDSLGIMGFLPLALAPFFLMIRIADSSLVHRVRIILLGLMPFVVVATPLLHFTWVSNTKLAVYYRITYSSLFWCAIAFFLYGVERFFLEGISKLRV